MDPGLGFRRAQLGALGIALLLVAMQLVCPKADLKMCLSRVREGVLALSVLLFAVRAWRSQGRAAPWIWLGFACFIYLVLWVMPRPPAMVYVGAGVYAFASIQGMLALYDEGLLWAGGVRRALEGLIFALALFALAWSAFVDVPRTLHGPQWAVLLTNLAVTAPLMGVGVFLAQVDLRRFQGPLGWLFLGYLTDCLANVLNLRFYLDHRLHPAHPVYLLDTLSVLAFLLAACAPMPMDRQNREDGRGQDPWNRIVAYMPFTAALIWFTAEVLRKRSPDPGLILLMSSMTFVLLIRQFIAIRDQASFFGILEQRLRERTQALEESQGILLRTQRMNLIATLGAGLAHDFKNLLALMVSLSEQGRFREASETAIRAAAMAQRMMNLHACEPEIELFECGEFLRERLRLFQRIATSAVVLELQIEEGESWVEADPNQMEQVMVNLLCNARDALPQGGTIKVRLTHGDGSAELSVADDGSGMEETVLHRLFEPFFTTKAGTRGTGLGLASVKAIVEGLGGTIQVESRLGEGTRFHLYLPTVALE